MEQYPLVSVVIPVYNTERFLEQCVQSVISQTYSCIEVILVDDGSTDGSPSICDDLSLKDSRIHVIHKKNGGPSDARNIGVCQAKGKYLLFLDSDDFWIHSDGLCKLVSIITEKSYDFLGFNCSYYYYQTNEYKPWKAFHKALLNPVSKSWAIKSLISSGTFPMSACMKLISRSFFLDNDLFFQKELYYEDIPWFIKLITTSSHFGFVNEFFYAYRKGMVTSRSSSFSEKKYNDLMEIVKSGLNDIQSGKWEVDIRDLFLSFWAYEYCILLGMSRFFKDKKIRKKKMDELKKYIVLLNYRLNPKVCLIYWVYYFLGFVNISRLLHFYLKFILKISAQ